MSEKNGQKADGDNNNLTNVQIGYVGSVTIIMSKDNLIPFPQCNKGMHRREFRESLLHFVREKLIEIGRSEEWLKAMAGKELNITYEKIEDLEQLRLVELCNYIDGFYLKRD